MPNVTGIDDTLADRHNQLRCAGDREGPRFPFGNTARHSRVWLRRLDFAFRAVIECRRGSDRGPRGDYRRRCRLGNHHGSRQVNSIDDRCQRELRQDAQLGMAFEARTARRCRLPILGDRCATGLPRARRVPESSGAITRGEVGLDTGAFEGAPQLRIGFGAPARSPSASAAFPAARSRALRRSTLWMKSATFLAQLRAKLPDLACELVLRLRRCDPRAQDTQIGDRELVDRAHGVAAAGEARNARRRDAASNSDSRATWT